MDLDSARAFARTHHHAVLATRTPAGGVQQSPVLVGVDEQGRFLVSTRETSVKARNLRADPRAHLVVLSDGFFGDWVWVEGTASALSQPEALEPLVDYFRRVSGEHPDWDDYRAAMRREQRVLVRIDAVRAGPRGAGPSAAGPRLMRTPRDT